MIPNFGLFQKNPNRRGDWGHNPPLPPPGIFRFVTSDFNFENSRKNKFLDLYLSCHFTLVDILEEKFHWWKSCKIVWHHLWEFQWQCQKPKPMKIQDNSSGIFTCSSASIPLEIPHMSSLPLSWVFLEYSLAHWW